MVSISSITAIESEFTTKDVLKLCGQEINLLVGDHHVDDLQFFPENPRIYSIVCSGDKNPSQDEIHKRLSEMSHVKLLIQSIKNHGGLIEPLIVRSNIVLEGNSRLSAYKTLANKDPVKWGKVRCKVLPDDTPDDLIFTLLGEYHLKGKKDWAPYEQAGYLYRRFMHHGVQKQQIAKELAISVKKVTHDINVYGFMVKHNEEDINKWSYYDEYLKNSINKKARKDFANLDEVVVEKIKTGEIPTAVDLREKLKVVLSSNSKNVKKFIIGDRTFSECYESAQDQGCCEDILKKLKIFRDWLVDTEVEKSISLLNDDVMKKCNYEIKKVIKLLENLEKKSKG